MAKPWYIDSLIRHQYQTKIERILTLIVVISLLTGCAALTGRSNAYPSNWPNFRYVDTQCPDVSGHFHNPGDPNHDLPVDEIHHKYLAYRLFGLDTYQPEDRKQRLHIVSELMSTKTVTLFQQGEKVTINFTTTNGNTFSKIRQLNNNDFYCSNGWLWIKQGNKKGGDGIGGYYTFLSIGLRKTVDGSLVGQERNSMVGALLWIIPLAGSQLTWYRWLATD